MKQSVKPPKKGYPSPLSLFVIIAVSIFAVETVIMILLHLPEHMSVYVETLLDASLLTILMFPALYFFLLRPMILHVNERKLAEEKLEKLFLDCRDALTNVKVLSGLLPICARCKKIRDDKGYWSQIESYIKEHSEAEFSHSLCPECEKTLYPEYHKEDDTGK